MPKIKTSKKRPKTRPPTGGAKNKKRASKRNFCCKFSKGIKTLRCLRKKSFHLKKSLFKKTIKNKTVKKYLRACEKKLTKPLSFQEIIHIIILPFSNLLWAVNFLIGSIASFFEFVGRLILGAAKSVLSFLKTLNQKLTAFDLSLDFYVDLEGFLCQQKNQKTKKLKNKQKLPLQTLRFYSPKIKQLTLNLLSILKKFTLTLTQSIGRLLINLTKTSTGFASKVALAPPRFLLKTKKRAVFFITCFTIFSVSFYEFILKDLPSPYELRTENRSLTTVIYDRNGEELYKVFSTKDRTKVNMDELPQHLIDATLAYEDAEFFQHHGVSLRGIIRAIRNDLFDEKLHGGSTITQQLIKNALLTNEKTIKRKAKEAVLSILAEIIYPKKDILQMYFNEIPYGGPIYGIEEAAKTYFGKHAKDLNIAEGTLLAGLPTSPSENNPMVSPANAKKRQKLVLTRMVENSFLTQNEAEEIERAPLEFSKTAFPIKAPHFVMLIKELLYQKYGKQLTEEGGLSVYTTLDYGLQKIAEKAVSDEINKIGKKFWIKNGAALVTKPKTGEVLTMVGSKDFFDEGIDGNFNITTSPRQPGSSIKVVNYSYALAHGYTPSSILQDSPVSYKTPSGRTYSPVNYDGKFRGPVTLHDALAMSLNVPAVKVLNSYGHQKMLEQGRKMGITTWNKPDNFYGLSLTLGAGEVKMVDMAVVYGALANQGTRINLRYIKKVVDSQGNVLEDLETGKGTLTGFPRQVQAADEELNGQPVIHPQIAYQLTQILADVDAKSPTYGRPEFHKLYIPGNVVATKTGTSNNKRDNWTFGYTPEYLVATWVGNNDNTPMNPGLASGITGAAPLWNTIMTQVLKDHPNKGFPAPEGLIPVEICASNGLLPCEGCSKLKTEYFIPGTEPTKHCQVATPSATPADPNASPPPAP